MKMRRKGKVHPFTSSSSSSPSLIPKKNFFPVLNLLPAAILALVSVLCFEEREVLAYMISRSLKSANPSFFPVEDKNRSSKGQSFDGHGHKSPALFDCDCFDCYTSFWFRWDSSPNRELIHQAIEAFEEHLSNGEQVKSGGNGKSKKKEKMGRRKSVGIGGGDANGGGGVLEFPMVEKQSRTAVMPDAELAVEKSGGGEAEVVAPAPVVLSHRGFARKVLPDVLGIFNSRLWSLWSPNM